MKKLPPLVLTNSTKLRLELNMKETSPFCHEESDGKGYAELEHLVHEMAHATLLRVPCTPGMSRKTGELLKKASEEVQALNESWCFIIECLVFEELGIEGMEWDSCVQEAVIQEGVTEDMMDVQWELWKDELALHAGAICLMLMAPTHRSHVERSHQQRKRRPNGREEEE